MLIKNKQRWDAYALGHWKKKGGAWKNRRVCPVYLKLPTKDPLSQSVSYRKHQFFSCSPCLKTLRLDNTFVVFTIWLNGNRNSGELDLRSLYLSIKKKKAAVGQSVGSGFFSARNFRGTISNPRCTSRSLSVLFVSYCTHRASLK